MTKQNEPIAALQFFTEVQQKYLVWMKRGMDKNYMNAIAGLFAALLSTETL